MESTMKSKTKSAAPVRNIEAEMLELYRESPEGKTEQDLIRAGFTKEQIIEHGPSVAAQIRANHFGLAA
jgi:hypothetical protein